MTQYLYTFLGCTTAITFTVNRSSAEDKDTALAACAELTSIGEAILTQLGANASDEDFKEFFGSQVTTLLEAVETLKQTSILPDIHPTLLAVLEYYYAAADGLMGGGGWPRTIWDDSLTSAGGI
jgi:hypothetical protein